MSIKKLDSKTLKIIAMLSMLIDHIGLAIILPLYRTTMHTKKIKILYKILRAIGRISFPIFIFFIVEGFIHVKNNKIRLRDYIIRLFLFGLVSEIPFDLVFSNSLEFNSQNVYFTLLFGLLNITCIYLLFNKLSKIKYRFEQLLSKTIVILISSSIFFSLAYVMHADYGGAGVLAITLIYLAYRLKHPIIGLTLAIFLLICTVENELLAIFAVPLIAMYNGKRGKQNKILFYSFYPLHLILLRFIKIFI